MASIVAVVASCAACGSSGSPHAAAGSGSSAATHIVLVIEENHSAHSILAAPDLPELDRLEHDGVVLTQYFAVAHPSLPNYLALTSGSTHGMQRDCGNCSFTSDNLAAQLQHAGITWKLYAQGLPGACPHEVSLGAYARRHVPFLYYNDIEHDPSLCAHIVPYSQFATDARAGTLPTFSMVIPDIDHDMHGRVESESYDDAAARVAGDTFLSHLYGTLTSSPQWHDDTRLVVTWDESGSDDPPPHGCCGGDASGGHVATIVIGSHVKPGTDATPYDHYSLLRSIEDLYHLPQLGAAAHATSKDIPAITG